MKSETMPKKKKSYLSRLGMTLLTILLIVLFIFIMSLVSKIQGTARVVNYAGLVRGKTQRIIKLEISGSPQDEMIADIDAFIDGLENGSSQLNLVRLDDPDFQAKMKELDAYFSQLKEEVAQVRMRITVKQILSPKVSVFSISATKLPALQKFTPRKRPHS